MFFYAADCSRRARKQVRRKQRSVSAHKKDDQEINWLLWRPCVASRLLPTPLASWSQMTDGTYDLLDVVRMHDVLDDIEERDRAAQESAARR